MRKQTLGIILILLICTCLNAIPQAMHFVPVSKSKDAPYQTDFFHIQGILIYCVDNLQGQIKIWDTTKKAFGQTAFAKLPVGVKATDITGDGNFLYVLDSKGSAVHIYNLYGKLERSITGKGSAEIQFKNAIRILVNYQGYIYVLDAGRNELLAFTNEGMFMGKVQVLAPLSMTLGDDQILRVLLDKKTHQEVVLFTQDLDQKKGFEIQTPQNKSDFVADISVNQYNEIYTIYAGSTKIGKVDSAGRLLPKSSWGSKDKGESLLVFLQPTIIKSSTIQNNVLLAILDNKTKVLKVYQDSDFNSLVKLEVPQLTMRPFLEEIKEPLSYDNLVVDSLSYYLYDAMVQVDKAKKPTRAIVCKVAGKTKFTITASSQAKNDCKGFDAMAVHGNKLYVVDSKSSRIFKFDRFTGEYLDRFASKGSKEGRLNTPRSIVIAPDGIIYIADWGNSRIAIFNENTAFIENLEFKDSKLKPQLLRISGAFLYFLANDNSIYEMQLSDPKNMNLMAQMKKISTFDILYENRLGFVDGETQQLHIIFSNKSEHKFFSKQAKSLFPGFGAIYHVRYNPQDLSLFISDAKASSARRLRFYYSPKKPQTIRLAVNDQQQAFLSWEVTEGINKWVVTEISEVGAYNHNVHEPKFVIAKPQQYISRYSVCSLAEDGKTGPSSEEIEDAYSYARYLSAGNNFSQAVLALKRAQKTIDDPRLDEEMVSNYLMESKYLVRLQEYEKALKSIDDATVIAGPRLDFILEKVNIYKLMKEYQKGITMLENFRADDNQSIQRQLIALHYLNKNDGRVQSLASVYLTRFGKDPDVIRYLALANENRKEYAAALTGMRELVTMEDNLDNNLKIGELLISNKQNDEAISHLQRMLTKYPNQGHDSINKLLGDAYYAANNLGYAADYYNNAIRANPQNAEYYYRLGQTYFDDRKSSEAQTNFAKAFELNPTNPGYGLAYARALEKISRFPEALAVLDAINKYVTADATTNAFHEFYADILTRERRYDDAYRELAIAVQYDPNNAALKAKLQSAIEARDFYNQARAPIEIKYYGYNKLFPALQDYYAKNPMGFVTLFNTRNVPIQDVKLTINITQITDNAVVINIPSLLHSQEHTVDIITPINNNIFTICRNGPATIATELKMEYTFDNQPYIVRVEATGIPALGITAMDWKNRRQFGSFVNPADENLRDFVNSQITQLYINAPAHQLNKNIQRAIQIWSYYHANGVRYVSDPTSSNVSGSEIDYVQFPFQTLARKSGDCEDLLALLAASLSVIGVDCGFIDIPGHVMLVIDSKMKPDEAMESGIELSHFIPRNNKYWIPIETTLLGKESFSQSWLEAIKRYNSLLDKGYFPDIIEFADAHKLFPPARYSEVIPVRSFDGSAQALTLYNKDIESIMLMGQLAKEEEFLQTIRKYPSNLNVANQYALWCVQNNRQSNAQNIWEQILAQSPQNFAARVNLGSLMVSTGNYAQARIHLSEALKQNKDTDNILRNLCILEYRSGDKTKAREYFNRLSDKSVLKNLDPTTYADLISGGN